MRLRQAPSVEAAPPDSTTIDRPVSTNAPAERVESGLAKINTQVKTPSKKKSEAVSGAAEDQQPGHKSPALVLDVVQECTSEPLAGDSATSSDKPSSWKGTSVSVCFLIYKLVTVLQ